MAASASPGVVAYLAVWSARGRPRARGPNHFHGAGGFRRVAGEGDLPWYAQVFAIPPTPGFWVGMGGLVLVAVGSALPWYSVQGRFPGAGYPELTTIVGFDGLNGLFVHPQLEANLGLSPPPVGFPVTALFILSAFLKFRKLVRSTTHRMRGATMVRGSLMVVVPILVTLVVVTQVPLFVPADAPPVARAMADQVSGQPFGGSANLTLETPSSGLQPGDLSWGFGPAVWVMAVAVVLMNVGSRLDERFARKAFERLEAEQRREGPPPPPPTGRAI